MPDPWVLPSSLTSRPSLSSDNVGVFSRRFNMVQSRESLSTGVPPFIRSHLRCGLQSPVNVKVCSVIGSLPYFTMFCIGHVNIEAENGEFVWTCARLWHHPVHWGFMKERHRDMNQWRRAWWWCRLKELSVENDANEKFSSDPSPLASDCFIVSVLHDDGLIYVGVSNPWQVRGRDIEWSCLYQMKVRQLVGVVMIG